MTQFDDRDKTTVVFVNAACHRGDLIGLVARTLHIGQHFGHCQQRAQIDRRRLMTRQNRCHAVINLNLQTVDILLALFDALDKRHIASRQGIHTVLNHRFHQAAHLQQLGANTLKIGVKLLVGMF